jgi:alkylation response protein AidB-like acyl-CoA dehydrogenase
MAAREDSVVQFTLTTEQRLIQESARTFLSKMSGNGRLRHVTQSPAGWEEAVWAGLASELGFAGLMVPEAYGGSGLGAIEMALVLEQTGRTLAVAPFFETAVLAVQLILSAGTDTPKQTLLPNIANGHCKVALAMSGPRGLPYPGGISTKLIPDTAGWRLRGEAGFVTFAHIADLLLTFAQVEGSTGGSAVAIVALPAATEGITIKPVPNLDLTRPFCTVTFDDVSINPAALLGGHSSSLAPAIRQALAIGSGLLAAEQTGGAAFCLASTVDYAKQRVQFGRAIGSFQAVKHALADMALLVEAARSAVWYAAIAIDYARDELFEATSAARVWCSDAYRQCASEAIQLHGGIGFTWEHAAHFHFKRSRSSSTWLGEPALHRERIAQLIGLDEEGL